MRYFSMFTGVGGFELGLENANKKIRSGGTNNNREFLQKQETKNLQEENSNAEGGPERFTCIGMSEIDKYSCRVLRYKFPGIKNYGDATKINPNELPDFDMLCGGTLFFEIARILKVKRPKIVLLENVKGLLNHDKGKTFKVILQSLGELGYGVQWMVCNSKFFGVPQNRERLFIVGNSRGTPRPKILPFRENDQKTDELQRQSANTLTARYEAAQGTGNYFIESGEHEQKITKTAKCLTGGGHSGGLHSDMTAIPIGIKQLNNPTHSNNRVYSDEGLSPSLNTAQGGNRQPKIIKACLTPDRIEKRQKGRRFKNNEECMFTLTGQDIHGIKDELKIRRLTPIECCRLQGFPDDFLDWGIDNKGNKVKISDSQKYKMMGNAITTNVITTMGEKILNLYNQ